MKLNKASLIVTLMALLFVSVVRAQEKAATPEKLGTVHFSVSCSPATQKEFDRAVALLHNFWFPESDKAFAAVAEMDPNCAMAYWGLAMGARRNPISVVPDTSALNKGRAAVEKAMSLNAKTQRERDYVTAVEAFYQNLDGRDHAARSLAYETAMERVYLRYPDDREAAVFYALALLPNEETASTDAGLSKPLKAGAILEKIFAEQPEHPGVAHYIIHAYDYPSLASRALPAAQVYAKIAPSSDHALHMPSHIFTRLGMWQESIQSNLAAAAAAKDYARQTQPNAPTPTPFHMLHFLMEAYLQRAQDREAKSILDELNAIDKVPDRLGIAVVVAGIPARYALERRQWAEAASLRPRPSRHFYAEATTYFTRAIGSARSGNTMASKQAVEKLESLRNAAIQKRQDYWAQQIEIQHLAASGWHAHAEGRNDEAVKLLRSAADLEDSAQRHHTARDAILPARELLGELLIEIGQPKEALHEFEAALKNSHHRFNGLYGAGRAAELSGNREKARTYYAKLVGICEKADTERAELKQAKAFLAKK
jgi:hypothetical protein